MGRRLTADEIGGLMRGLEVVREPVGRLCEYEGNAKQHTAEQVEQIKASIREFGMIDPIGVWTNAEGKSEVVEGHGRLMAARELGLAEVPVIHLDALTDEQRRAYALVHNQLTMNTGWDFGKLDAELDELSLDFDMEGFGFEMELDDEGLRGDESVLDDGDGQQSLADRFGIAPFSVIDARKGDWIERKRAWVAKGIRSELGRGAAPGGSHAAEQRAKRLTYNIDAGANAYRRA